MGYEDQEKMSGIPSSAPPSSTSNSLNLVGFAFVVFIALCVLIGCLGCCTFFVKWCTVQESNSIRRRRRSIRMLFPARMGLDKAVLDLLPIFEVKGEESIKEGLECAVCLSEFRTGEQGRILPNCSHSFHTQCIDAWFECHVTCPLCRCNVSVDESGQNLGPCSSVEEASTSSQSNTPQISECHVIEMVSSSPCSFREENTPDCVEESSTMQRLRRLLSSGRRASFSNH